MNTVEQGLKGARIEQLKEGIVRQYLIHKFKLNWKFSLKIKQNVNFLRWDNGDIHMPRVRRLVGECRQSKDTCQDRPSALLSKEQQLQWPERSRSLC